MCTCRYRGGVPSGGSADLPTLERAGEGRPYRVNVETLIVGAAPVDGAERFYTGIVTCAQRVIACDAAAEWCLSLGRRPDAVVGDFDSATRGAITARGSGYPRDRLPRGQRRE